MSFSVILNLGLIESRDKEKFLKRFKPLPDVDQKKDFSPMANHQGPLPLYRWE